MAHYKPEQWQQFTLYQDAFGFGVFKLVGDLFFQTCSEVLSGSTLSDSEEFAEHAVCVD